MIPRTSGRGVTRAPSPRSPLAGAAAARRAVRRGAVRGDCAPTTVHRVFAIRHPRNALSGRTGDIIDTVLGYT